MRDYVALLASVIALSASVGCDDAPYGFLVHAAPESGELPELPAPITAAETTALRTSFAWNATSPLAETDGQGRPALYYCLVLVQNDEQRTFLDLSGITYDAMPLFPEELNPWTEDESPGMISFEGDDHGTFVFALMPGAVFNALREEALSGRPAFEAVVPRSAPPTYVRPEGYLDLDSMVAQDFSLNDGAEFGDSAASSAAVGRSSSPLFTRILRGVIQLGRGIANSIRHAIAKVKLEREFTMTLRVLNSDSNFYDPRIASNNPGFVNNILTRAWGPATGQPIAPHGAKVMVRANMGLATRDLRRDGTVAMSIPRDRTFTVFLKLRNEAANFTAAGIFEQRVKLYHGSGDTSRRDRVHLGAAVRDSRLHAFSLLTDAYDYVREVLHRDPRRAVVSSGPLNAGSPRASDTPCWSFFGFGTTSFGGGRGWSFASNLLIAPVVDYDMVLRGASGSSRLIPVHEYGHFVMCDILFSESRRDFGRAYGELIQDTIASGGGSSGGQTRKVAEAWADTFAAQAAGGVNYFTPPGARNACVDPVTCGYFCDASRVNNSSACLEDNIGAPFGGFPSGAAFHAADAFTADLAQVVTVLVDAFDGAASGTGVTNGVLWSFPVGAGLPSPTPAADLGDENVAMNGYEYAEVLKTWARRSTRLHIRPFFNAVAIEALARHDEIDVCQLFGLHDSLHDCRNLIDDPTLLGRLVPLGAPLSIVGTPLLASPDEAPKVSAAWNDVSEGADGYRVEVLDGASMLLSALLSYDRSATWSSPPSLPFDHSVTVRVYTLRGSEIGAFGTARVQTDAQPVTQVSANPGIESMTVSWTPTAASGYIVRVSGDGRTWDVNAGATTSVVIPGLTPWVTYSAQVYSLNAAGALCPFPSPTVSGVPWTIVIE